jgi:hypothetical protein
MSDDGVMGSVVGAVMFVIGGLANPVNWYLVVSGALSADGMTSREVPE